MNGPPLVIYGAMRRWSPQHFRATLQAYFLPASLVGLSGYWLSGLWVPKVTRYFFLSLPMALAAILLGRAANRRLHGRSFIQYMHGGLIVIGAALLFQVYKAGRDLRPEQLPPRLSTRPSSHAASNVKTACKADSTSFSKQPIRGNYIAHRTGSSSPNATSPKYASSLSIRRPVPSSTSYDRTGNFAKSVARICSLPVSLRRVLPDAFA
jgi:hypothetical protein